MTTTLYRGGRVVTPAAPGASALVVADGTIAWVGSDESVGAGGVDEVVDLGGAVVTPAFVDAHVHATTTGLMVTGLDLHDARGARDVLDRVAAAVRAGGGRPVLGTGWDESTWDDPRLPTLGEIDRAAYGGVVYLSRADVHSALVSSALLLVAGVRDDHADGVVRTDAHHATRRAALASLTPGQVADAQRAALAAAAAAGIGCVHEMAGPDISGLADLESLLQRAATEPSVEVVAYWAALGDVETPSRLGLRGGAGDLFCDGSVGSHTAALHQAYTDAGGGRGRLYHDAEAVAEHVAACARAGLQSGFHVIGDRAVDAVLDGYELAAARLGDGGPALLRGGRHRLEHVEMASPEAVRRISALGLVASVQPAFDARWGGPGGMYEQRLGTERARGMNAYAALAAAGVVLAFGSDAPVTPFDPWGAVRAAVEHRTPESAISARAAFAAHTRGGWRAAREDDGGVLVAGAPATFAVWDAASADPALWTAVTDSYAFELPEDRPTCLRTVVRGRRVFAVEGVRS